LSIGTKTQRILIVNFKKMLIKIEWVILFFTIITGIGGFLLKAFYNLVIKNRDSIEALKNQLNLHALDTKSKYELLTQNTQQEIKNLAENVNTLSKTVDRFVELQIKNNR